MAPPIAKRSADDVPCPNILMIQLDQLSPHALRYHGNKVSKTPNIDRLMCAETSTVFSNAYCASPICSPSRFSMLSGQLPTEIQAWDNAAEFPSHVPTFAHLLRLHGYATTLAGKMHFVGADQLHGFEERLTTDVYPADFGWTPNWDEEANGKRNPLFFETFVSVAEADWVHSSMQMEFDEEVAFKCRRKLREISSSRRAKTHLGSGTGPDMCPFFLLASFTEPHDPYSGPREFWDQYEGVDIDMPIVPFIPPEERDVHSRRVYYCMDNGDYDITTERIIKARRAYYSMLSYVDSLVGGLLRTLEEQDLMDDTLIILTSDHGDMQGERGMWFKETFHERSTRVPLFFYATEAAREKYSLPISGKDVHCNVSLLDLLPTMMDIVTHGRWKQSVPFPIDGRSMLGSLRGDMEDCECAASDTIYCEYTSEMIPGGWFMVKKGPYKYIYSESAPILYDLSQDPNETKDVVDDPKYKEIVEELGALAKGRWPNVSGLKETILRSQRQRRLIHAASLQGHRTHWDFEPRDDSASRYVRNTEHSLQDQEYVQRAPFRGERPTR